MNYIEKPKYRTKLRSKTGLAYYALRRKYYWLSNSKNFAKIVQTDNLPYVYFAHKTLLRRELRNVDMWMQENKIINLKIAVEKLNGLVLKPEQILSYWYLIGKPTRKKGYVDGMILQGGDFCAGVGGGLCQLSNLIFWLTIHTPLTVIERHRHGYDVFPDSNRTQPFGSGATCFYPHGDLMIKNNTDDEYRLQLSVGETHLKGCWQVDCKPQYKFEIVEKNHEMKQEFWGGYSRHNQLYQKVYDLDGELIDENLIVENSAIMMYPPFLE